MSEANTRRRLACLSDLPEGGAISIDLGEKEVALFRVDSKVYAVDNLCSHGGAWLCEGFLDGYDIECPLHQATFDIRTGAVTRGPADVPIASYSVEVDAAGEIYLVGA